MLLTYHESTIRPRTVITVERGRGRCFVRLNVAGFVTYEESWDQETRARERFERVVDAHEKGEPL